MTTERITPNSGFAKAILGESGVDVNLCYQCGKCAAGCPVAYVMDYPPAQLIHAARLGLEDLVLSSKTIWLCAACETCTTRCPQDVDIAKVMDAAKILGVARGYRPALGEVRAFHKAALANVRRFGRMWEAGMIVSLKLRTRRFTKDLDLGKRMLRKGKLRLFPTLRGARRAARVFSRVEKAEEEREST
ncbi:MAG: 4Fe-4S dicluster domain-containing protein [Acidobacteriota bacterium]|nr:4Fe-4S dicluster domain-containing protein [Acidobacteriota bacterium]